jgi:hypothetical protein
VRAGLLVHRLGWYGETAASRMLHPNRLRRNSHPGISFASYDPRSECLNCHGRGPVPLSCSAARNLLVVRFALGSCRDAPQRLRIGSFAPTSCSMRTRVSENIIWSVWCPARALISQTNRSLVGQPDCVRHTAHPGVSIHENADSAYTPDPPYALPCARVRTAAQINSLKWRRSGTDRQLRLIVSSILMAPGSWATAPQRDGSCRMGGNVPGVTAWVG